MKNKEENKFRIRFSKEHGGKYYETVVSAKDEQGAFLKARDEAKEKGIELPKEVWTRIDFLTNHKKQTP